MFDYIRNKRHVPNTTHLLDEENMSQLTILQ